MLKTDDPKTQTIALLKGKGPFSYGEKQDAIWKATFRASMSSAKTVPGDIYKSLQQKTKDVLEDCKSEDWHHRIK